MPRRLRVPVVRSAGFRARSRPPLAWLLRGARVRTRRIHADEPVEGRLDPGDARHVRLVGSENGEPARLDPATVETWVKGRAWLVVDTALGSRLSRIVDNRPARPDGAAGPDSGR